MQLRIDIKQSIWCSSRTLPNPKAIPLVIFCTARDNSGFVGCDTGVIFFFNAISSVLAKEEMFSDDFSIAASTSSFICRFLFLVLSADGVSFWGVIEETMTFCMLLDPVLCEVDELENDTEEDDSMESATDAFSFSAKNSESATIKIINIMIDIHLQ